MHPEQSLKGIPKMQKRASVKPLSYFEERYKSRDEGMAKAYLSGHYTLEQVGDFFGVSYATVGRSVKKMERGGL